MNSKSPDTAVRWREWSKGAFDKARDEGKLVLLDLSAEWCHWCHVMDSTTYSDTEVARTINERFVPVRVDIDRRPDISERYNRGGFPTTAFLSDRGESVWGATYIPPSDMRRIMRAILDAKASGEIDEALERNRMQYLDLSKALEKKVMPGHDFVESLLEDIFATYDVEHGGFGIAPKFPHPDVVDLLLFRYAQTRDSVLADAVAHTLNQMTRGLYDPVDGGVFRYSVTRDWREPHYEKMLETNVGFLRNLVHAHVRLGEGRYAETARGVAGYLLDKLRDPPSGGFFGSQDADEVYYRLSKEERARRPAPAIIKAKYGGWNAEAACALVESGVLLGEPLWIEAGKAAWLYLSTRLRNPENGLLRHAEGDDHYLFEDQVPFLEALIAMLELSPDGDLMDLADALTNGVDRAFAHPEGGYGDVISSEDAIGELSDPRRSLVTNSKWARLTALLGAARHRPSLAEKAREILGSFTAKEVESYGLFASEFVSAFWTVEGGAVVVEVHAHGTADLATNPLWLTAKRALNPGLLVMRATEPGPAVGEPDRAFAVVCTSSGCSKSIEDPEALSRIVRPIQPSQV